jgi:hypothetical protein
VRGRDLGSAVEEAMKTVNAKVQLPRGYHIDWEGEYESQKRATARLALIVPLTILLIFIILYSMFRSFKWAGLILATVVMAPIGGILALLLTGTNFSVSSGVGFLALFGSVRANGSDHARIHQPASRARLHDRRFRCRRRRPEAAAHHDDHAGGHSWAFAGGHFSRDWLGLATAFRHRDRRRPDGWLDYEYFLVADFVCLVREGRRQAP